MLVLGSGGREHALAWALSRSASVSEVLVAPGNAGSDGDGMRTLAIGSLDAEAVVRAAREEQIELVVVGPEAPLCAGVVDALAEAGIDAFGPRQAAARLEGSKAFMKRFCSRHDIPTAPYLVTEDVEEAERYIDERGHAVVVKADGLCGGKGAVVARDADHAMATVRSMLRDGAFGDAGRTIIVEDRLDGVEISVHAISDGERFWVLPVSRDHKRIGDGDSGPNTGGMGAFAPVHVDRALMQRVEQQVLVPTLAGMRAEGCPYRGVLYAGLMVSSDGTPYLLEHNVRFGDPETQVLMAMLDGDVGELLSSAARGKLDSEAVQAAEDRHAVAVVLASAGYPSSARKGDIIRGVDAAAELEGVQIIQAGTARSEGELTTAGGRVLSVTAIGSSAAQARERAYAAIGHISWDGMQYRRDIAASA